MPQLTEDQLASFLFEGTGKIPIPSDKPTVYKDFRKESKTIWGENLPADQYPNRDDLKFGAMLRIADSLEIIAKDKTNLEYWLKHYQEKSVRLEEENVRLANRIRGFQGYIKKIKNQKS